MRTFTSPSGRSWTVTLFYFPAPWAAMDPEAAISISVLRFRSDGITLDLADWPSTWLDLSDDELIGLLRAAQPPLSGIPAI